MYFEVFGRFVDLVCVVGFAYETAFTRHLSLIYYNIIYFMIYKYLIFKCVLLNYRIFKKNIWSSF
jgi:hypothetical protein